MSAVQPAFALRPFEIKHVFDFAIRLLRSRFAPLFLSMAMVQVPLLLLTMPLLLKLMALLYEFQSKTQGTGELPDSNYWLRHLDFGIYAAGMILAALVYQLLVLPLGNLVCARLAVTQLLGEPCSFGEAFAHARKRYWPTQVALALFMLPLVALAVLVLVIVLLYNGIGNTVGVEVTAIGGITLLNLAGFALLLLFVRVFMAVNGMVQAAEEPEGSGVLQQGIWLLRRSWELTGGEYWRMLGYLLLLAVVVYFIANGMSSALRLVFFALHALTQPTTKEIYNSLNNPSTWEIGCTLAAGGLFGLIFPPYWQCFKTLLYFDMRCRKEGFDLLRMLQLPGGEIVS